jgi:hypothetical protein
VACQQLNPEQRKESAVMLSNDWKFDDVLDHIQQSADNSALSPSHLAIKRDLDNVVREFNLSTSETHCANDDVHGIA